MFGWEIAATVLYAELSVITAITDVVEERIYASSVVPASAGTPALLYSPTSSQYNGPVSGAADSETLGIQVRFVIEGQSTAPLGDAPQAMYEALAGRLFTRTIDGVNYAIDFTESGEAVPIDGYDSGTYYRIKGVTFSVNVTRG